MNIAYICIVPVAMIFSPFSGQGVQCWRRRNEAMAGSGWHRFGYKGGSSFVDLDRFSILEIFPTAFRRLELPIDIRSLKRWWKGLRKTLRAAILANYEKSTWNWPVDWDFEQLRVSIFFCYWMRQMNCSEWREATRKWEELFDLHSGFLVLQDCTRKSFS